MSDPDPSVVFAPAIAAGKAAHLVGWYEGDYLVVSSAFEDEPGYLISANGDGTFQVMAVIEEVSEADYFVHDVSMAASPDDLFSIFENYAMEFAAAMAEEGY